MSKFSELNVVLTNKTILLDVSHAKEQGDDLIEGGIVLGKVYQSEVPTYGYVVAFDPAIETLKVGDIVPIAHAGALRVFHWPEKSKAQKIVSLRFDMIDGVIKT